MAKDNRVINGAVRVISGDFAKAGKPKAAPVETKEADNKEAGTKDK